MLYAIEVESSQHTSCHVEAIESPVSQEELFSADTAIFAVEGMGCPTCATRVRNGLLQIDGVLAAEVVLRTATAKVWYDPSLVMPAAVAAGLPAITADGKHHYAARLLDPVES